MARIKHLVKAAWVLLLTCLLAGAGGAAVQAGNDFGIQFVLVSDLSKTPGIEPSQATWSQAAGLLVHLLQDQDYLGVVSSSDAEGLVLPTNQLTPSNRAQVLGRLARLAPGSQSKSLSEVVPQALMAFQAGGPKQRVMLILSDGARETDPLKKPSHLEGLRQIAAQAQRAGVAIMAVSLSPKGVSDELKVLTSATRGRFWDVKAASDLPWTILKFYQDAAEPQEVPMQGADFHLDQWVRQAVVMAARSVPGQGVAITSPAGFRITPRTSAKTIQWIAGPSYDLITISQPNPGTWRLTGAKDVDSRVLVTTDLTLSTAGTPREVGEDEALTVTAVLSGPKEILAGGEALSGTDFRAELKISGSQALTEPLRAPEPAANPALPPDSRVGRFPALHQEGQGTLRVLALGKTFQRSVSLPITVTQPWYRLAMPPVEPQKKPIIRFQPDPARHPEFMRGTVTVQSAQGALSGVLVTPAPGAEIVLSQPPGCQELCLANLQLRGTASGGRPLVIASGPFPKIAAKVPEKPAELKPEPASEVKAPARKSKRRWLWLALIGVGISILLVAALLLWRERPRDVEVGDEGEPDGPSGNNILRLQAQVEALNKEKGQLQSALEEKNLQVANLQAEKTDLQKEVERISAQTKDSIQSIEDLEKKLEEAEKEAKGFQQEYMALYARNQKEKEAIKKN